MRTRKDYAPDVVQEEPSQQRCPSKERVELEKRDGVEGERESDDIGKSPMLIREQLVDNRERGCEHEGGEMDGVEAEGGVSCRSTD